MFIYEICSNMKFVLMFGMIKFEIIHKTKSVHIWKICIHQTWLKKKLVHRWKMCLFMKKKNELKNETCSYMKIVNTWHLLTIRKMFSYKTCSSMKEMPKFQSFLQFQMAIVRLSLCCLFADTFICLWGCCFR
jgi:hypothetical protein